MPGRIVRKSTYIKEYHELDEEGWRPVRPRSLSRKIFSSLGAFYLRSRLCAAYFGPFGPSGRPDPTIIQTAAAPRLLLPVAVRASLFTSAANGNARAADRPGHRHPISVAAAISFW